ncbi:neuronal acetylcholine receptor subunit alpha-10-like [Patiria miniata]|uniref:Uncharacterized protein n=1 Tax=Patiria miniata TaxID=46514 RepID=A0A914BI23_PATMI|nr:neuronal acetylcholine receptor subunit alpha-10-like [Patiria miniata]
MVRREHIHPLTLPILIVMCGVTVALVSGNNEKNLVAELLGSYGSKSARPVQNTHQTLNVTCRLLIAQIIEFNEPKQQLTINAWQRLSWRDEFLVWDPVDFGGQTELHVFPSDIWTPRLALMENVNFDFASIDDTEITISPNGTVNWYTPVIYQVSCKVDVRNFPFDVQQCNLTFLPWVYDKTGLALLNSIGADTKQTVFSEDGVWSLVDVDVAGVEVKYACCENPFSHIIYTLTLERSSSFYIFSILIPSVLLTTITLAVFWMPAESGEKISLGMTNLLAFVLFQQLIAGNMPPLGDQTPIITVYLFCMVVLGCASIFVAVYALRLYHTAPDKPIPKTVVGVVKCLSRQKIPVTWQAVSRMTDKAMFVLFLVASIVILLFTFISIKHDHTLY